MLRSFVTISICAIIMVITAPSFAQQYPQQYPQAYPAQPYPPQQPYPSDPYQQQIIQTDPGVSYDPYGGYQHNMPYGQAPTVSVPSVSAPVATVPQASIPQQAPIIPPQQQGVPPIIGQPQMIPGAAPQPMPPMQEPQDVQSSIPNAPGVNVYRVIKNGDTTYVQRKKIIDPSTIQEQESPVGNCQIPAGVIGMHVDQLRNIPVSNPVRILGPNSQATMDYAPNRTNFILDQNQVVISARCG